MLKTLTLGAFQAHCYILTDEANQNCVLIDPGDEGSRILHSYPVTARCPSGSAYLFTSSRCLFFERSRFKFVPNDPAAFHF